MSYFMNIGGRRKKKLMVGVKRESGGMRGR
jgi:hypothetical protein